MRFLIPAFGLAAASCLIFTACRPQRATGNIPSVIVLGIDGMDPAFVERHWDTLPNLAQLRDTGHFGRLATTSPPQSPVAWSTFITGLEPAQHGIFDFVHRDATTLLPFSSMARTAEPKFTLPIGPYRLPLSQPKVISLRRGMPFWQLLSQIHVPVSVIRMPTNYPALQAGNALSGMGTPDLGGTLSTFSFYTDEVTEVSRPVAGGRIIKMHMDAGHADLSLAGPPNSLRQDHAVSTVNLVIDIDHDRPLARLRMGDELIVIKEGEWSDWLTSDFVLLPHLSSVRGMFRVFAKQLHPGFELYVSPINVDPTAPVLPIAAPPSWSQTVARETGRFNTVGIPEDTAALRQHVLTLPQFRAQTKLVFDEEKTLLGYSLSHFRDGLLFFYFSSIDQNAHMLWGRHEAELLEVYQAVDGCVGEVRKKAPAAELIIMSDHGFTSFDRAVHLNAWLNHRRFLSLTEPASSQTSLSNVDWSATEAYAIGLNGLYVNQRGREKHGTIATGEQKKATLANLREQLLAWRDPLNGRAVVTSVQEVKATAENAATAPDLIVGYGPTYRGSWQTGLGNVPAMEIEDNEDEWIGDHCVDPAAVPGVLFTSRLIEAKRTLRIQDVTASVLGLFGLGPPTSSNGQSFFQ
jgi:predicted AlkP superfamily phosphohydrolase/phosphomutase